MNLLVLLRITRWIRHPPSPERAMLILGVIAACLVLAGIELFLGWPDWLTPQGDVRGRAPAF